MRHHGVIAPLGPILVGTDFSSQARHAALRAARLAHESRSTLTLMHVRPGEPLARMRAWLGGSTAPERWRPDEARRRLLQLATDVAGVRPVEVCIEQAAGSARNEIVRAAERLDARLLVLGARGVGLLRRLLLGTTAARLAHRTDQPVLVVRQAPDQPYRRVLVAVDGSPASHAALALARRLAPDARLVVLTVFQLPGEGKLHLAGVEPATIDLLVRQAQVRARQQLHALVHEAGLSPSQWEPCVVQGDVWTCIAEQAQLRRCDLVVLGRHGRRTVADHLLGSVTRRALAEGPVDVLVSSGLAGGRAAQGERR